MRAHTYTSIRALSRRSVSRRKRQRTRSGSHFCTPLASARAPVQLCAAMAVAAIADALAAGAYEQLAPLCDAAELEVRGAARTERLLWKERRADACVCACVCVCALAQAGGLSAPDWPHAVHLLGHVFANDLCAPVVPCRSPLRRARLVRATLRPCLAARGAARSAPGALTLTHACVCARAGTRRGWCGSARRRRRRRCAHDSALTRKRTQNPLLRNTADATPPLTPDRAPLPRSRVAGQRGAGGGVGAAAGAVGARLHGAPSFLASPALTPKTLTLTPPRSRRCL
jgi:hypothetical protein